MNQNLLLNIFLLFNWIIPFLILLGLSPHPFSSVHILDSWSSSFHTYSQCHLFLWLQFLPPGQSWPSMPLTSLRVLCSVSCPLALGRREREGRVHSREQSGERWWKRWRRWRLLGIKGHKPGSRSYWRRLDLICTIHTRPVSLETNLHSEFEHWPVTFYRSIASTLLCSSEYMSLNTNYIKPLIPVSDTLNKVPSLIYEDEKHNLTRDSPGRPEKPQRLFS